MARPVFRGVLLVLALLLTAVSPALAQQTTSFFLNGIGDNAEAITSARCLVLTAGTNTAATIYSDGALSSTATNPITANTTTGLCTWYATATPAAYDVLYFVDGGPYKGARVRVDNVTRTGQKTVLVRRQHSVKMLVVPFSASTGTVPTQTTYTIPAGGLITGVVVRVVSAAAQYGARIDVGVAYSSTGTAGTGGLCSDIPIDSTGFRDCAVHIATHTAGGYLVGVGSNQAINYSTAGHSASGYLYVTYLETGNEP